MHEQLFAIFVDYPRHCMLLVEGGAAFRQFDAVTRTMILDGRAVKCAWIVDSGSEHKDVIAIFGQVPIYIAQRYKAWQERSLNTPAQRQ